MQIIGIVFLVVNTLFTIYLGVFKDYLNFEIPDASWCPDTEVTKESAYLDQMKK